MPTGLTSCVRLAGPVVLLCVACSEAAGQDPRFTLRSRVDVSPGSVSSLQLIDMDGDGDPDLLVADALDGAIRWYESDGDVEPSFVVEHDVSLGIEIPQTALGVDVNGDGAADVGPAVSTTTGRVIWLESDSAVPPAFTERDLGPLAPADTGGAVTAAAAGDLTGNGRVDLVAGFWLDQSAASGHLVWYRNLGGEPATLAATPLPTSALQIERIADVVIADIDGDGNNDIAAVSVAENGPSPDGVLAVWLSSGGANPTFTPLVIDANLARPLGLAAARLDGNASVDLAVVDEATDELRVYRNNGQSAPTLTLGFTQSVGQPRGIRSADTVGSARPDLLVASQDGPLIFENLGGVALSFAAVPLETDDGPADGVATGDADRDGDADAAFLHGVQGTLRWHERVDPVLNADTGAAFARLDNAFASSVSGQTLLVPNEHLVRPDLIDGPPHPVTVEVESALRSDPRSAFGVQADMTLRTADQSGLELAGFVGVATAATLTVDAPSGTVLSGPSGMLIDGSLDANGPITIRHNAAQQLGPIDNASGGAGLGDLLDLPSAVLVFRPSPGMPAAVAAIGEGAGGSGGPAQASLAVYVQADLPANGWLGTPVNGTATGRTLFAAAGDLNRDGADDLVSIFVPTQPTGPALLLAHISDGEPDPFFLTTVIATQPTPGPMRVIDLNRDGLTDIVTPCGVYLGVGANTYSYTPFAPGGADFGFGIAVEDFDADGTLDAASHTPLLSAGGDRIVGYEVILWLNDGQPTPGFTPTLVQSLDRSGDPGCVGDCYPETRFPAIGANSLLAADLNLDKAVDLVLGEDGGITAFLADLPGPSMTPQVLQPDARWARTAQIDTNDDGVPDLVFAAPTLDAVGVLEQAAGQPGLWQNRMLVRPVVRASGVAVGDLNSDDRPDVVFSGGAFDRIGALERLDSATTLLTGAGGQMTASDGIDLEQGGLFFKETDLDPMNGDVVIRDGSVLIGNGSIAGSLFNAGTIRATGEIAVAGTYKQTDPARPDDTGTLAVTLDTQSFGTLAIGGNASLAGGLVVQPLPGAAFSTSAAPLDVVTAEQFDASATRFDAVQTPTVLIDNGAGQVFPGVLRPSYDGTPGDAAVQLLPRLDRDPGIENAPFVAIGTPADGVVFDLAGPKGAGPDGLPDLVVAYPQTDAFPLGAVAVFLGDDTTGQFGLEPIGLYTGVLADRPIAVEAGDFDADGIPEIAFVNERRGTQTAAIAFLRVDPGTQPPIQETLLPPVPLPADRDVRDLSRVPAATGAQRGPAPVGLVAIGATALEGTATVSTYDPIDDDWDSCDIDVCDDPDSVDPIDADGASATLGTGFAATSAADDKVIVAYNTGGVPDTYPTLGFGTGANPTELRAEDLDLDGFPDLAVINETGGSVSVLINTAEGAAPGGRSFAAHTELPLRGDPAEPDPLPSSIALADLDDDGDLDIAVVSTNAADERAVRWLENLVVPTGVISFASAVDLPTQPAGVPLLVREADAGTPGAMALTDDLVVLIDPDAVGSRGGGPDDHEFFTSLTPCPADVNGDGIADAGDFFAWVVAFNAGAPAADQNGDGIVDASDFFAWVAGFGAGCP